MSNIKLSGTDRLIYDHNTLKNTKLFIKIGMDQALIFLANIENLLLALKNFI